MKRGVISLLAAAAAVVAAGGWLLAATWHLSFGTGLYCAVGTATTVGCDAAPGTTAGRIAAVAVMLTAIPLLAAVFAWLTGHHAGRRASAKVKEHLDAAEKRIAEEADGRHVAMQRHVERLLTGHCADIKDHVSAVADAQAIVIPPPDPGTPATFTRPIVSDPVADGPVSGGAGSNPAEAGLNADGLVVPPPATAEPIEIIPLAAKGPGNAPPPATTPGTRPRAPRKPKVM